MSEKERNTIVAARGRCKASITRLENYLLATKTPLSIEELQVRQENLIYNYNKLQELSLSLQLIDEDFDKNGDESGEIEERYICLMAKLKRLIGACKVPEEHPKEASCAAKLPTLDIPTFNGIISEYKPFVEMFQAVVHNDSRITDIQRLCFLKKYLKGEPLQIIDSLPITGKSYNAALDLLSERYDNPALIVSSHVSCLLDLPNIQRGTATQLRDMVAKVRQHTTALKNLNQPVGSD